VQKFNADGSTHENLVVLNHDGHATVQSTESGTIYLVNDNVVVNSLATLRRRSNQWASTTVTANTSATISAANLAEGTYHAYAVDAAGNLRYFRPQCVGGQHRTCLHQRCHRRRYYRCTAVGDTVYTTAATHARTA
jgi:hypothetical protein